jgi:glycosyltransferase involved in cell wall biosynthesis
MNVSNTHLIILPTYNTGPQLRDVVTEVLRHWQPVLVVVDGSTDGSERQVLELAASEPALIVMVLPRNTGKGAAVLAGARAARERGFSHALVMDADGQHPANSIAGFMDASDRHPDALILGRPIFPENTPAVRRHGRKLSIGLVHLELLGPGIADPLFGFRVYPLAPLLAVLEPCRGGRRYDFDTEAAVRLGWAGVPPHNLAAPVRYFSRAEGGVSHFHYLRDNAVLVWMHTRLIAELLLWRWPGVLRHRRQWLTTGLTLAVFLFCATLGRPAENRPAGPSRLPAATRGAGVERSGRRLCATAGCHGWVHRAPAILVPPGARGTQRRGTRLRPTRTEPALPGARGAHRHPR